MFHGERIHLARRGRLRENIFPVVRFVLVCTILEFVAHMDLKLVQMDVKTTFLHWKQDEVIFMDH